MFNEMILSIGGFAVEKVLDDEKYQELFKDVGRKIGEEIPGNFAEPKINKVVDLVQEGMMETVNK
jgi:general stress protein YciG